MSAIGFLFSLERLGMKFGLDNIARLCAALGHPERACPSVLIGGTNGKGSVAAMTDAALRAAGHRTGRYTSPHLVRLEERFAVDGRDVSIAALEASAGRVRDVAERLVADGSLEALPTFFECTTAVAFDLFREAAVDLAVLEVGLGGRLDSTNIVSPLAVAIVSIAFDHEALLGNTLAAIAFEKAGIIKPGIPVVCGPLPGEAMRVITEVCAERQATLIATGDDRALTQRVAELPLALGGRHQQANAAVAWRLLEAIDASGLRVSPAHIEAGLRGAHWPARLERLPFRAHGILIDAAHNPAGAAALAAYLRELEPAGAAMVFGAMHDKAIDGMLRALAPAAHLMVCTTAPSPRAMDATALAARARAAGINATAIADPAAAVAAAAEHNRLVVVAGSIFLAGPVRELLLRGILR